MVAQYLSPAHRWNSRNYPGRSVTILPAESVPPFQRLGNPKPAIQRLQTMLNLASCNLSHWLFYLSRWICLSISLFILGPPIKHFVISKCCVESWAKVYILNFPDFKAVNVFLSLGPCDGRLCLSVLPLFEQRLRLMCSVGFHSTVWFV